MKRFLFWNASKKDLTQHVARLAHHHAVDVLILAECPVPHEELLDALNSNYSSAYFYAPGFCTRIQIFVKFAEDLMKPVFESERITIRRVALPGSQDILLVAAHLPDKCHWSDDSQNAEAAALSLCIEKAEDKVGHSRTVLVGDLNMNPFQPGMVNAFGLHGVMTKEIASRGSRVVQSRSYKFFYNPMWGLFGDRSPGPPGTYYRQSGEHKVYFWNILDQVLIRPDLLDLFSNEFLAILDNDGESPLVTPRGYPDRKSISDHLPIKFQLDI